MTPLGWLGRKTSNKTSSKGMILNIIRSNSTLITESSLLMRETSLVSTAVSEFSRPSSSVWNIFWLARSVSSLSTSFPRIDSANSFTSSSLDFPPSLETYDWTPDIAEIKLRVSRVWKAMSAFVCSPKISGLSIAGRLSMYWRYSSSVEYWGA